MDASGSGEWHENSAPTWAGNVLRNSALAKVPLGRLSAGEHRLRLIYRDPGVVFEHIVMAFDGSPPAYPVPPEKSAATLQFQAPSPTLNLASHARLLRSRIAGAAGPRVHLRGAGGATSAARCAGDRSLSQRKTDRRGDRAQRQGSGRLRSPFLEAVLDDEPLLSEPLLAGRVDGAVLPGSAGRSAARDAAADGRGAAHRLLPHHRPGPGCAGGVWKGTRQTPSSENRDLGNPDLFSDSKGGSKRKGRRLSAEEQDLERRVLARLASGEPVKVSTLRTATAATLPVLAGLTRKKWIARETAAVERDARRTERFAVLIPEARLPALTVKQQAILAELAACDGELPLAELRRKDLPSSTLQTLVRRGLVRIDERPAVFRWAVCKASLRRSGSTNRRSTPWPAWRRPWGDSIPFCCTG
jgi:hypothetical protein